MVALIVMTAGVSQEHIECRKFFPVLSQIKKHIPIAQDEERAMRTGNAGGNARCRWLQHEFAEMHNSRLEPLFGRMHCFSFPNLSILACCQFSKSEVNKFVIVVIRDR